MLRYASHVACLHVLSACAGAQNPVSALNSNASSLPPLQCDHFVTLYNNRTSKKLYCLPDKNHPQHCFIISANNTFDIFTKIHLKLKHPNRNKAFYKVN